MDTAMNDSIALVVEDLRRRTLIDHGCADKLADRLEKLSAASVQQGAHVEMKCLKCGATGSADLVISQ